MAAGAACTAKPKQQIFRFNPGKTMTVFPPKHPYYKANGEVKKTVEKITSDETRLEEIIKELPDNLTNEEKKAIAQNYIDIEKTLNITKGKPMPIEEATNKKLIQILFLNLFQTPMVPIETNAVINIV